MLRSEKYSLILYKTLTQAKNQGAVLTPRLNLFSLNKFKSERLCPIELAVKFLPDALRQILCALRALNDDLRASVFA